MSRIRTIKPDFWRNQELSEISPEAALLAIGLLNMADDEGYFQAHPKLIESDVFPLRTLPAGGVPILLKELFDIGYINLFVGNDKKSYGQVVNFEKHQNINRKTASRIKEKITENSNVKINHGILSEDSVSNHGALSEDSLQERKGMEGNGREKERKGKGRREKIQFNGVSEENAVVLKKIRSYWSIDIWNGLQLEFQKAGLTNDQGAALMIQRGWKNFQAEWINRGKNETHTKPNTRTGSAVDRVKAAIRDAYSEPAEEKIINGSCREVPSNT